MLSSRGNYFRALTLSILLAILIHTAANAPAQANESSVVDGFGSGDNVVITGEESVVYEEPAASAPSVPSGSGESDGGAVVVETQQSSCDDRGAGADACRLGELLARATG
ncbi:hypothetical protein, partial [Actinomyces slackii]|uniref:hypothetical protein n=1 Tax=Actinomyces slackii TaxID=52774 RepID=UPI0039ED1356